MDAQQLGLILFGGGALLAALAALMLGAQEGGRLQRAVLVVCAIQAAAAMMIGVWARTLPQGSVVTLLRLMSDETSQRIIFTAGWAAAAWLCVAGVQGALGLAGLAVSVRRESRDRQRRTQLTVRLVKTAGTRPGTREHPPQA